MAKSLSVLLILLLSASLITGGLLHAVVPHNDGDEHHSQGIIWGTLHSAIQHEDKKVFAALPLFIFTAMASVLVLQIFVSSLTLAHNPLQESVRRGREKYRRFS